MLARTILVPFNSFQPDSDLQPCIDLARAQNAHLNVLLLGLETPMPTVVDAYSFSEVWVEEVHRERAALNVRDEQVKKLLAAEGISASVTTELCPAERIDAVVGSHARYCDLAVMAGSRSGNRDLAERAIFGALFEAAKPVVVVPEGKVPNLKPGRILVAWDGDIRASRAVSAAIPLMMAAKLTEILCVDPARASTDIGQAPGWDLATYLARHDIKVEVSVRPGDGVSTASVIMRHAEESGADMIVMGAYGHSRFRQRLFGGTTRTLLESAGVPVFLVH